MKLPSITITDEELYEEFFTKLEENNLSVKDFINKAILDYCRESFKSEVKPSSCKKRIVADSIITELAIRYLEEKSKAVPKPIEAQASDYSYVSRACMEILKLIDTPLSKRTQTEFDQESALHYINQTLKCLKE